MAYYDDDMYPVSLEVDYPEEGRNRLTALVRIILAIPIFIIIILISGYSSSATRTLTRPSRRSSRAAW